MRGHEVAIGIVDAVVIGVFPGWRFGPEQASDLRDIGDTFAVSKEPVVADAVLAFWQNMDQEPADELFCLERHGDVAIRAIHAVIFDPEGDAALIHPDQAAVGDRNPVGVSRQIRQHGLGAREGFCCVNNPINLAQRFEDGVEDIPVGKVCEIAEELQFPHIVQPDQPIQNEPPVQTGQNTDGQEEVLAAGDPF